jgi:hypothetical protein
LNRDRHIELIVVKKIRFAYMPAPGIGKYESKALWRRFSVAVVGEKIPEKQRVNQA